MKIQVFIASATMMLSLAACSDGATKKEEAATTKSGPSTSIASPGASASENVAATLAQGPDVCFKALAKHLGAETKVAEITSFFSTGPAIDSSDDEPAGQMTTCTAQYQNPNDPLKLLSIDMDMATGAFSDPAPVEISVMGDAASFRLEDHIVPLSQVQAAALAGLMESQKPRLDKVFSKHAWSGVRLEGPGPFADKHTLRIDVTGRLAANDIKESGYALVALNGQKIETDHLTP